MKSYDKSNMKNTLETLWHLLHDYLKATSTIVDKNSEHLLQCLPYNNKETAKNVHKLNKNQLKSIYVIIFMTKSFGL